MIPMRNWTWQTWAIFVMAFAIVGGQVRPAVDTWTERAVARAKLALPKTSDFWEVTYVSLERGPEGRLVVFTDAHANRDFDGRFKVSLRSRDTNRHAFTPQWSDWLKYRASAIGETRYNQPETLQWWAALDTFFEPPPQSWAMETCWQARIDDEVLGLTELEPVCITSLLDAHPPAPTPPDFFEGNRR